MIKRLFKVLAILLASILLLTSCYTYTIIVGEGAQGHREISKWNHYAIFGLAPIAITNVEQMAGGTINYTVKTEVTFWNGLVTALTYGIYSPTTTTVIK